MSDDFDGLLVDADSAPTSSLSVEAIEQVIRGESPAPQTSESSLTYRAELVSQYHRVKRIEDAARSRRRSIEQAFVQAGAATGANEIRTATGIVKLEAAQATYEVKPDELREALRPFIADNTISEQELNEACPVTVTTKVNHVKLNYLARHRGEAVAEVIEAHRTRKPGDPLAAKPKFPKESP